MKNIFLILSAFFILTIAVSSQNWQKLEGTDPYINVIFVTENEPDRFSIAADNAEIVSPFNPLDDVISFPQFGGGLFISDDRGETFSEPKFASYSVFALAKNPDNEDMWYASIRRMTRSGISLSDDGGDSWNETGPFLCEGSYQIMDISTNAMHYPEIYAAVSKTDKGFMHTNDDFTNCTPMEDFAIQSRSIAASPVKDDLVFIAGDDFYAGGVFRSYNKGKSWLKDSEGIENLRIHCVLPSNSDPAIVYCGADSVTNKHEIIGKGIYMSLDTGKTWQHVGAFGATCFDLAQHPYEKDFIVAACGNDGVYLSGSEGYAFENLSEGLLEETMVTKVAFPYWEAQDGKVIALAGTHGDGLYISNPLYTSVNEMMPSKNPDLLKIYPNPAKDNISVLFELSASGKVSLSITDNYGRRVYRSNAGYYPKGQNIIDLTFPENISSGIYYVTIKTEKSYSTGMMTVVK